MPAAGADSGVVHQAKSGQVMACQQALSQNPTTRIELPGHHENPSPLQKPGGVADTVSRFSRSCQADSLLAARPESELC